MFDEIAWNGERGCWPNACRRCISAAVSRSPCGECERQYYRIDKVGLRVRPEPEHRNRASPLHLEGFGRGLKAFHVKSGEIYI